MSVLELTMIVPELIMAVGALLLLVFGVFKGDASTGKVSIMAILVMIAAGFFAMKNGTSQELIFSGVLKIDAFSVYCKLLILISAAMVLAMSATSFASYGVRRFEFPILVILSSLGMMLMTSARDLLVLYVALELASLSLYIMAAMSRDSERCVESGLKYFVLGALASGMMLYGISFVYGFTGSTSFSGIASSLSSWSGVVNLKSINTGVSLGLILILIAFLFKISAAPFHMWTPDVYEGAPTPVTAFFSSAPKIAAFAVLLRFFHSDLSVTSVLYKDIISGVAIITMLIGAFAALKQTSLKRLLAYSSIGHVGYMLVGFVATGDAATKGILIYLTTYIFMTIGAFACLLYMRRGDNSFENISDLAGLHKNHPRIALALSAILFSMAGIPPLAGFFGKMYVFLAAVQSGLYVLATVGVVSSVVAAYYYLQIIRVMYFEDKSTAFSARDCQMKNTVLTICVFVALAFIIFQNPILELADIAAASLTAN